MDTSLILVLTLFFTLAIGGALGATIAYLYSKARAATLEAEHAADLEKIDWIRDSQEALRDTFDALAAKALHENAADFSGRIQQQLGSHATHIGTLKSSLELNITKIDQNIRDLERKREAAYQGLTQNIANLQLAYSELRDTTAQLLNALKSGPVRGKWGEIQLRKIVELAGMNEHVSFFEQVGGADGKPDMVVHLPNQGQIIVDAKFPLQAFLEAMASIDPSFRQLKLAEHAKTMRQTIKALAKKGYWEQFQPSPEIVIMFIPVESCLMAAYECDPEIIEFALSQKVILASPITLLGFMKAIAYGWQQFVISKNAKVILEQGKELHKRAATWLEHFRRTGEKIGSVIDAYNASVSSLQSRFFPAARRFEELTSIAEELSEMATVNKGLNLAPRTEDVADRPKAIEATPLFDTPPTSPVTKPICEVGKIWAVLGDSVIGTSHRARNGPCQDAFRIQAFGSSAEWLVIVAADGAGSASHSQVGATVACEEFARRVQTVPPQSLFTREGMTSLFADVRTTLLVEAERLGIAIREVACTALLMVLGPASAVFAQLGDGAIVIGQGQNHRVVFWPEPAEYANATNFLTDDQFVHLLQFETIEEPIVEVAAFTDGLQRLALDFTARVGHPAFFQPLFNQLRTATDAQSLVEPFRNFLDSDRVNERTDDDKTLVLAVRHK